MKNKFTKKIVKKAAILILIFFALFNFLNILPVHAAGASLFLTPSTGTYIVGDKFTIAVKVFSGKQVINAAEGIINFDKNFLEVVGISKSGSIFTLWTTEPSFSNSGGIISFGGGLPPPGYSGQAGVIIKITFKAKAVGAAQVRFSSGAVLANDGKGTNILETMGSGSFTVSTKESAPESKPMDKKETAIQEKQEKIEIAEYNKPNIESPTHPDENTWYSKGDVEFNWDIPDDVSGVSFAFNKDPNYEPGSASDGLISTKAYNGVEDGTWYFHLKFFDGKKWGTADHYRALIDKIRPLPFTIDVEQKDFNNWPLLFFKAVDELSGVMLYEVYINSIEQKILAMEESEDEEKMKMKVSSLEYGEHTAMVRAVDKAGNETFSTVHFKINPVEAPVINNYSKEIKPSDQFFASGSSLENMNINVYVQAENGNTIAKATHSDKNGNWFLILDKGLENGRYVAWVEGENINGLKSAPSEKVSFLVSPPVFAKIGSFVINYFTVFASLFFMVIVVIASLFFITNIIRKKLKKETVEVEDVLQNNMAVLKKAIITEVEKLKKTGEFAKEKVKAKKLIEDNIEITREKIFKEIKDVEDILK